MIHSYRRRTLLVQLRGVFIRFAAAKKREKCRKEETLIKNIESLTRICNTNKDSKEDSDKLKKAQGDLVSLRNEKLHGSKIRSRANWIDKGEKLSRYFLKLEKSNYINKTIKKLPREDNSVNFSVNHPKPNPKPNPR